LNNIKESKDEMALQGKEMGFYKNQIKNLQSEIEELKGSLSENK
jgi:hypothetical protein